MLPAGGEATVDAVELGDLRIARDRVGIVVQHARVDVAVARIDDETRETVLSLPGNRPERIVVEQAVHVRVDREVVGHDADRSVQLGHVEERVFRMISVDRCRHERDGHRETPVALTLREGENRKLQ